MNPALLEALRATIHDFGLGAYTDAIIAKALPAVRLNLAGRSSGAVGESRIGGVPDLPAGMVWPHNTDGALSFIAQINLGDVPRFEGNPLPSSGMLYFFIGLDEPASDVDHLVLLHTGDGTLEPAVKPGADEFAGENHHDLEPHRLSLELFADVPRWATGDYDALTEHMNEDEQNDFGDLGSRNTGEVGQLLGHVSSIGHDTREDAFVVREVNPAWLYDYRERAKLDMTRAAHWTNLLRVDSTREVGLSIWDAGFFNVLVKDSDLGRLDFTKLYVAIETS